MGRLSAAERRSQILAAAHAVILEKGLGGAATRDVTRRLQVGAGLLHHYFPSWRALRAEAVRTFMLAEIAEVGAALAEAEDDMLIDRLADWLADDPGARHWGLWLTAIDEARRDAEMAEAVRGAYRAWRDVLLGMIERLAKAGYGRCADPAASAWRLNVMMDGLAGLLLLGEPTSEPAYAKQLLKEQFVMELQRDGQRDKRR